MGDLGRVDSPEALPVLKFLYFQDTIHDGDSSDGDFLLFESQRRCPRFLVDVYR